MNVTREAWKDLQLQGAFWEKNSNRFRDMWLEERDARVSLQASRQDAATWRRYFRVMLGVNWIMWIVLTVVILYWHGGR